MNCEYCTTEDNRNDAGRVFYKELIHDSIIRTTLDDTHLQLAHDKNGWVLHFEDESGDRMFDVPINACPMCGASLSEPKPLTLDELRECIMGEPLYVKLLPPSHAERWEVPLKIIQGMERLVCKGGELYFLGNYGITWLAYRNKPKEEER